MAEGMWLIVRDMIQKPEDIYDIFIYLSAFTIARKLVEIRHSR